MSLYSFRLNDTHDRGHPQLLATFKKDHPEWSIGEGHAYGDKVSLNFAVPEVRDLKFAVVEEVFRKYDFDGLEIDFMRSPPYFLPGTEPDNAYILTRFMRRIRSHLDQRGEERGRPITLAARVNETIEGCRLDGFDVATWISEGLIDIIIMGSGAIDIEVAKFKELTSGTDVLVYPCLYGIAGAYRPTPVEMARALAVNYWHQGADGIYMFSVGPLPRVMVEPDQNKAAKAVRIAERACEASDHGDPDCLDALSVTYAEAGRSEDALKTARHALDIAMQQGQLWLALSIQDRLATLETRQPYRWHFTEVMTLAFLLIRTPFICTETTMPTIRHAFNGMWFNMNALQGLMLSILTETGNETPHKKGIK